MLVDELLADIGTMKARLDQARAEIKPDFPWYPYDILANFLHLGTLLHGENRDLGRLAGGQPVADIGGADGDLAFALEAEWGWSVDVIDYAAANQNRLMGARALREHLGSNVSVQDTDLDMQFELPRERYGLVFLLGILYHLQNPFYVLRRLAQHADHCLLSTKVARCAGAGLTRVADIPIAYLVSPTETNNDATNYWMFSPAGLERLVDRAGWAVLERMNVGDTEASNPSSPEHDERMFMLLRSNRGG
jgi:2-polyprenyl-3-methyl-5-hydroxy-6-metoxy-1,4-benzoquinol methylase